jgi:hypothetical protein
LQEYMDVLPSGRPSDLPPLRGIECKIDLGEEDEMPSRTTPILEGEDDEDIPTHDERLRNQQGGAQGRGQGAGQVAGRAQQEGVLLGDGFESYSDSRTTVTSN